MNHHFIISSQLIYCLILQTIMPRTSLYALLKIAEDADDQTISQAKRKRALEYHPDRFMGCTQAEKDLAHQKFLDMVDAYDILIDPDSRRRYDIKLLNSRKKSEERATKKQKTDPLIDVQYYRGESFDPHSMPLRTFSQWLEDRLIIIRGSYTCSLDVLAHNDNGVIP